MGALELSGLPAGALLLLDSAPIIYCLEEKAGFFERFEALFALQAAGEVTFAVTTITIAEVLAGPFKSHDDARARRYRAVLESWRIVELNADLAEAAARLRASMRLRLPDAIQAASALAINADALVTHDRDFSMVSALRIIS